MNKLLLLLISVFTINLTAQTGLPVWPLSSGSVMPIQVLDWQLDPVGSNIIPSSNFAAGSTGAAFDGCGRLVFFAIHTGSSQQNNLFIYNPNGVELLSNTTTNAPGLNGVRGSQEIQVIRVPETSDEWFIIYSEWNSDTGAPQNNGGYLPARLLYSRVQFDGSNLNILERDIVLNANGQNRTYNDGRAVTPTANGDENTHYLYSARRSVNDVNLSLDRFLINNSGIFFDANSGNVFVGYWDQTHAFSPIESSMDGSKIAVVSRNVATEHPDVLVFDAQNFNVGSTEILNANEFFLVADGSPNDQSAILNIGDVVENIAADVNLELQWLQNFHSKISNAEWSPNGQFLYLTGGGFAQGGVTNLTYLAQVDMTTNPKEVRLQVQETPNNGYNILTGIGCGLNIDICNELWQQVNAIQSSFDEKIYFSKRNDTLLYVIPNPDVFMPQNLTPSNIDLSTPTDPNISTQQIIALLPDQIDGFDYLKAEFAMIDTIQIDTFACPGDFIDLMNVQIQAGDTSFVSGVLQACDTVYQIVVEELPNIMTNESITICAGESASVFGNIENAAGEYVMTFTAQNTCDSIHTIFLEVLEELTVDFVSTPTCLGETSGNINTIVSGGAAPYSYLWSNGMTTSNIENLVVGNYSLTISDANNCELIAMEEVGLTSSSSFSLEAESVNCFGDTNANIFISSDNDDLTYSLDGETFKQDTIFSNLAAGQYTVFAQDLNGCIYEENITVEQPAELLVSLPLDTLLGLGDSLEIIPFVTPSDSLIYLWTPGDFLNCETCSNPVSTPFETVFYTLEVRDTFGCSAMDEMRIALKTSHEIFLPNAFSPNDDGINDFLFPFADSSVEQIISFQIYNRWGAQMFSAVDIIPNINEEAWDGNFRGQKAPIGVYVFVVEVLFVDGVTEIFRGDFTLFR